MFYEFINMNASTHAEPDSSASRARFKAGQERYGKGIPEGLYERPQSREAKFKSGHSNQYSQKGNLRHGYSNMTSLDDLGFDAASYARQPSHSHFIRQSSTKMPFGRTPFSHHV